MTTPHHDLLVGTFNTPSIFTLRFIPPSHSSSPSTKSSSGSLKILKQHPAIGSHSWLHLNPPSTPSSTTKTLYATAWTDPPTLASYSITSPTELTLLNTVPTKTRSGYVCASSTHAYSAGGASGEVYAIDPDTGSFTSSKSVNGATTNGTTKAATPTQTLTFIDPDSQRDNGSTMDFGGLRHGAHSADLSPDGSLLYIADIGRNCIWMYSVSSSSPHLTLAEKKISPRSHDGPRHVHPHPNGKVVYCLQEHSSVVDVFDVVRSAEGVRLAHRQGVRIIPAGLDVGDFWADEVRTSLSDGVTGSSRYMYASTRGLKEGRKGYVAVYQLDADGYVQGAEKLSDSHTNGSPSETHHQQNGTKSHEPRDDDHGGLLAMYETVTSGGWANAVQPGPTIDGVEYLAMTDSEVGFVFVLGWDGVELKEVARVDLNEMGREGEAEGEKRHGAATAVWLG